ncbi:MAG: phosphohistidine-like domain-containing protein [Candidatus Anammoxibacter sp.]
MRLITKKANKLFTAKEEINGKVKISFQLESDKNCILHWGFCNNQKDKWYLPAQTFWPDDSRACGDNAVQSKFVLCKDERKTVIELNEDNKFVNIVFVLFFPDENQWDNNNGKNYYINLQNSKKESVNLAQIIKNETNGKDVSFDHLYIIDKGLQLAVAVVKDNNNYNVIIISDITGALILHWGIGKQTPFEWQAPPVSTLSPETVILENKAAQTPFVLTNGLNRLVINFKEKESPLSMQFVLKQVDTGRWFKNHGANFNIPVSVPLRKEGPLDSPELSSLINDIVESEKEHNSVTLMHRFNLCYNLLDRTINNPNGLAVIYVWMRFSAIRQLDWQRNYNTQPKELSHAQDRLTLKLADIFINNNSKNRELIRLIITTSGRGGEGQRIRDDILHIMHRHHIKEVSGHFIEEWHQKLHNNTTPDDIVICRAYLEFLRSNGDLELFYKTLNNGGVTKERLESFERPIVTPPDFVPHIKDGLIYDFDNYLKLLKSIHSGTDLETCVNTARYLLDEETGNLLNNILYPNGDDKESSVNLAAMVTDARRRLVSRLNSDKDVHSIRSLLYLDLALEQFLRVVVERNLHLHFDGDQLVELIGIGIENFQFSYNDDSLLDCFDHWQKLKKLPRFGHDWSLHARSILDRLERLTGSFIDNYYQLFQPNAELLGKAFKADSWAINLFSEEVVRGTPAFVLSQLIRHIDPLLRKAANLGNWQIISRGEEEGAGKLEFVSALKSIQGKVYSEPTVLIADKVMGDEEIPENIKAVITREVTDIVAHVAVRARNARILFATCYDEEIIDNLKSLNKRFINFAIDGSGDVVFNECTDKKDVAQSVQSSKADRVFLTSTLPGFTGYTIPEKDFKKGLVGGKSINIANLRTKLPEWIRVPKSTAIPFGVFEKILKTGSNKSIATGYKKLADSLDGNNQPEKTLSELRKTILELVKDDELLLCLQNAMKEAKIICPENIDNIWTCVKRVWASKWNDRAYFSRRTNRIPHKGIFMAVLIQQVVNADYAFVIHTANPFSGDKNELYAEVVSGLGETLVSNYPGRALGFTTGKASLEPKLLSFPGKSVGLFGKSVIFRSDSNGEDLEGYAGAGLYDSVMLEAPQEVKLEYRNEPLVMDADFRNKLLVNISKIGIEIENIYKGIPQDIEGVFAGGRYYVVQTRSQVGV